MPMQGFNTLHTLDASYLIHCIDINLFYTPVVKKAAFNHDPSSFARYIKTHLEYV